MDRYGALEGEAVEEARRAVWAQDVLNSDFRPPPNEDGTPNESLRDVQVCLCACVCACACACVVVKENLSRRDDVILVRAKNGGVGVLCLRERES